MLVSIALMIQDPPIEEDRESIAAINQLAKRYIELQSRVNMFIKMLATKPPYLRDMYREMGELHHKMGVIFTEMAERK